MSELSVQTWHALEARWATVWCTTHPTYLRAAHPAEAWVWSGCDLRRQDEDPW